ncbi:hypothetical protein BofuT4_uP097860.1 [Botrytis cinerea T4]|uniref:Uncharacterized protein n=1 Tax=Botryotinia fuckeliana (strain T4) TaxID=999810 RepID=G2YCQ6_BOTF4|nr:hypothetical protein BofuT4_uP097860.1 [Botrytis cinerea T4]
MKFFKIVNHLASLAILATGGKSVGRSWAYQARCIGSCEHDNVGTCHIGLVRQDECVGKNEVRDANFRDP